MTIHPPRPTRTRTDDSDESYEGVRSRGLPWQVVLIAVAALVLAATVGAFAATSPGDDAEQLGLRPAPAFDVERLDESGRLRLEDYRGTPVIVNFWASWCTPCRQEMPELDAVDKRFGPRLAVIGINMQDRPEDARALLAEVGVSYPTGIDTDNTAVLAYEITVVPSSLFITADGRFAGRASGKPSAAELDELIQRHFGLS